MTSNASKDQSAAGSPEAQPATLTQAFSLGAKWLEQMAMQLGSCGESRQRNLCYLVIGRCVVASFSQLIDSADVRSSLVSLSAVIRDELEEQSENFDITNGEIEVRLLAGEVLARSGEPDDQLDIFRRAVLETVTRSDEDTESPGVGQIRSLLQATGALPLSPDRHGQSSIVSDMAAGLSLEAADDKVTQIAAYIERESLWGTQEYTLQHAPWLAEILAGFAAHRLRRNSLLTATRLLRAYQYTCHGNDSLLRSRPDLFYLILALQRDDGRFGWMGAETAELERLSGGSPSHRYDLSLPVTVDCLWTLAECCGLDWRLVRSSTWRLN